MVMSMVMVIIMRIVMMMLLLLFLVHFSNFLGHPFQGQWCIRFHVGSSLALLR